MGAIASEITSLTIVHSIVYWAADHRKHQSSASLAFVQGIHRGPVNSPHKWPVMRKIFHLMTSSCDDSGRNLAISCGTTCVDSLRPSDDIKRNRICHHWLRQWLGAKFLHVPEPLLNSCQLNPREHTLVKFQWKYNHFLLQNAFENVICKITTISQWSWGQHGAHLGPVGPRWAPCKPHEPCYQGLQCVKAVLLLRIQSAHVDKTNMYTANGRLKHPLGTVPAENMWIPITQNHHNMYSL